MSLPDPPDETVDVSLCVDPAQMRADRLYFAVFDGALGVGPMRN